MFSFLFFSIISLNGTKKKNIYLYNNIHSIIQRYDHLIDQQFQRINKTEHTNVFFKNKLKIIKKKKKEKSKLNINSLKSALDISQKRKPLQKNFRR